MENKIYKLNFKTFDFKKEQSRIPTIIGHYNAQLKDYFKEIGLVDGEIRVSEFSSDKMSAYEGILSAKAILPHNPAIRVHIYSKSGSGGSFDAASFFMYSQNNCCGAMSVSNTVVVSSLYNRKLATILQYLKEDIAVNQNVGVLTCTDVIYDYYKKDEKYFDKTKDTLDLNLIKPYKHNHRLLLKSGWVESKLFYNNKSQNVVALFTKDIKENYQSRVPKEVSISVNITGVLSKIENVMIGGDPEVFLFHTKKKEYVPSFNYIEGEKGNPTAISTSGHAIQVDNCSLEYNFPPCKTAKEFVRHNLFVQEYIKTKICDPNGLELKFDAYAKFKPKYLKDKRALTFGCDVDFDAWRNGAPNQVGNTTGNGRSGGGHLHLSYDNHNPKTSIQIVKLLDYFIAAPLLLMEPDNKRKEMYGKAGAYRLTKFGLEYRVSSNFIYSSEEMMHWVFERVAQAIDYYNSNDRYRNHNSIDHLYISIKDVIRLNRKDDAKTICKTLKIPLLKINTKEICAV